MKKFQWHFTLPLCRTVINGVHNDTQQSSGSLENSTFQLNASYLFSVLNIYMLETCLLVSEGWFPA